MVCVHARIHVCACGRLRAGARENRVCAIVCFRCVCVGSDQTPAFESRDGCQSNARGRKCEERRQTQT